MSMSIVDMAITTALQADAPIPDVFEAFLAPLRAGSESSNGASQTSIRAGSSIPTSGAIAFIGKLPFWNARFA